MRTWPHTIRPTFLVKAWTRWRIAGREFGAPVITRHCGLEETRHRQNIIRQHLTVRTLTYAASGKSGTRAFSWPLGSSVRSRAEHRLRLESFKAKMLRIKQDYAEGEAFDGKVLSETQKSPSSTCSALDMRFGLSTPTVSFICVVADDLTLKIKVLTVNPQH